MTVASLWLPPAFHASLCVTGSQDVLGGGLSYPSPQLSIPLFFKPDASGPETSCEFNLIPLFQQHAACLGSACSPLIRDIHHSKTFLDIMSHRNYKPGMDSYRDSLVNSLKIANGNTNRLESLLYYFFYFHVHQGKITSRIKNHCHDSSY